MRSAIQTACVLLGTMWGQGAFASMIDGPYGSRSTTVAAVFQSTPGLHIGMKGKRFMFGASLDLLGGVALSGRDIGVTPVTVVGPFARVDVVINEGTTSTLGLRGGVGAAIPTASGGFIPVGVATFDYGRAYGAARGSTFGVHLRSSVLGLDVRKTQESELAVGLGLEFPLLPIPFMY